MSIASFSIKRPIIISSIVVIIIFSGSFYINKLGVDLYPDVELPFIVVQTVYEGASPEEVEEQISKPIEGEISSIAGLKSVFSRNFEGYSVVWGEFALESDVKYCEQQVRDKVARAKKKFPYGVDDPVIERYDMSKDPAVRLALMSDTDIVKLYDIAKDTIKPAFEQLKNVGSVTITGEVKREIGIDLDQNALNRYDIPALYVSEKLKMSGINIPIGKNEAAKETFVYRSVGQYSTLKEIEDSVIFFSGDASNSVTLKNLAKVRDGTEDPSTMAFFYDRNRGKDADSRRCVFINVYKQSGTNTLQIVDLVMAKMKSLNSALSKDGNNTRLVQVYDNAKYIKTNVNDVKLSIIIGIALAICIVYLFLGNIRSTIITGIAIPNSLLGGFILMYAMGFTINMLTLLALSLTVGLLIDDAIVVRENIFRKLEHGMPPEEAAEKGTMEVMMPVIATTVTLISVFAPIAFMEGIVGRFFKQFGLTVVFIMLVSLFDALTVAPLLSAYFSGKPHRKLHFIPAAFERFQNAIDRLYERVMRYSLNKTALTLLIAFVIFAASLASVLFIKSTFMPPVDDKEFKVSIELPSGTSLNGTRDESVKIENVLKNIPELEGYAMSVGSGEGKENVTTFFVKLVPEKNRIRSNTAIKTELRKTLTSQFAQYKPIVSEYSISGDPFPFAINISGDDLAVMEEYSNNLISSIKEMKSDFSDVHSQYEGSKTEYQVVFNKQKMAALGITPGSAGSELRTQISGSVVGQLKENGNEYDIRLRLQANQRDISKRFNNINIPNINGAMVPLHEFARLEKKATPSLIVRENRKRIIQLVGNLTPGTALGSASKKVEDLFKGKLVPPNGVKAEIVGEKEDMEDLQSNIKLAMTLALFVIYLVLASLYGSFITPFTILLAVPPALSGAFLSLVITGKPLDIYSMIGLVMLIGLVTKNSILLVDFAVKKVAEGMDRKEAVYLAGRARLRPILMTTFAMLAGTFPIALGVGEAGGSRMAMGIAIIGGMILSTLLTLVVVPSLFSAIDRFRFFIEKPFSLEMVKIRHGFTTSEKKIGHRIKVK